MKLEQQVCNLDLAKRLKDFGVKQESLFYWQFWPERRDDVMARFVRDMSSHREVQSVSAFTVAELGEMWGKAQIVDFHDTYMKVMHLAPGQFNPMVAMHKVMTQPDISADILASLLGNKLITL
jgi:hypothetical protein